MTDGRARYIAVEGCIGVGKTTLATRLAKVRKSRLVLEEFKKNPFLTEFYQNPSDNVFETEMQFLLLHFHQLKKIGRSSSSEAITDFTIVKDEIFAAENLTVTAEKKIFSGLYTFLSQRLPAPSLIIYLKASDQLILNRIRKRNRSMELTADVKYFKKLNAAYDAFFSDYGGKIHRVDADVFDGIKSPRLVNELSDIIDSSLGVK